MVPNLLPPRPHSLISDIVFGFLQKYAMNPAKSTTATITKNKT